MKYDKYIQLPIHPRTRGGKPQLHTERVIFSHISYLNHCRLYYISSVTSLSAKKDVNEMFTSYILNYLTLYMEKISPICADRVAVVEELLDIIDEILKEKQKKEEEQNVDILFQTISIH